MSENAAVARKNEITGYEPAVEARPLRVVVDPGDAAAGKPPLVLFAAEDAALAETGLAAMNALGASRGAGTRAILSDTVLLSHAASEEPPANASAEKAEDGAENDAEEIEAAERSAEEEHALAHDREVWEDLAQSAQDEAQKLRRDLERERGLRLAAEARAEAKPARGAALASMEQVPRSVADALALAGEAWPDRLCVLPSAEKSAQEYQGPMGAADAWEMLRAAARDLWELRFVEGVDKRLADEFKLRSGLELSVCETSQTRNQPDLMASRMVEYRGENVSIEPHIKSRGRKTGKKTALLRLYFHLDDERKLVVVGRLGAHMRTAGTRRM